MSPSKSILCVLVHVYHNWVFLRLVQRLLDSTSAAETICATTCFFTLHLFIYVRGKTPLSIQSSWHLQSICHSFPPNSLILRHPLPYLSKYNFSCLLPVPWSKQKERGASQKGHSHPSWFSYSCCPRPRRFTAKQVSPLLDSSTGQSNPEWKTWTDEMYVSSRVAQCCASMIIIIIIIEYVEHPWN